MSGNVAERCQLGAVFTAHTSALFTNRAVNTTSRLTTFDDSHTSKKKKIHRNQLTHEKTFGLSVAVAPSGQEAQHAGVSFWGGGFFLPAATLPLEQLASGGRNFALVT